MVKFKKITLIVFLFSSLLSGSDSCKIADDLNLSAASKASIQWERVFKSDYKMKKYKIDTLSKEQQERLKEYLISHAIDSDRPTVAGGSI